MNEQPENQHGVGQKAGTAAPDGGDCAGQERLRGRVVAAVVATGCMTFAGIVVETAMNIAFPTLMSEFEVGTSMVRWMTTAYLLAVAVMVPLSSVMVRRFTTRSLFIAAILLFTLGTVTDDLAPNFSVLLGGRVIQGIGTGIALPLMFYIILRQVPAHRLGLMMGVGTAITAIGPAVGPTYAGVLVSAIGWRWIFWLLLPLLVFAFAIGVWAIEQSQPTERIPIDALSVLLLAVALVGLIIGMNQIGSAGLLSVSTLVSLCAGLVAGLAFVLRSRRITQPLIRLRVFGAPVMCWAAVSLFLLQFVTLGLSYVIPNQVQDVLGGTALEAGLAVLPGAANGAVMSPLRGRLLDKLGARGPVRTGFTVAVVAVAAFAAFSSSLTLLAIVTIYPVYMIGMGLSAGNTLTSGTESVRPELTSDANAALNTIQQAAGAFGTAITTAVVTSAQGSLVDGDTGYVDATSTGISTAYTALAAVAAVGLLAAWMMTRGQQDPTAGSGTPA